MGLLDGHLGALNLFSSPISLPHRMIYFMMGTMHASHCYFLHLPLTFALIMHKWTDLTWFMIPGLPEVAGVAGMRGSMNANSRRHLAPRGRGGWSLISSGLLLFPPRVFSAPLPAGPDFARRYTAGGGMQCTR
jgi:hypothetical protein